MERGRKGWIDGQTPFLCTKKRKTMDNIKIQPMEDWLQDRVDLLQAKIVMDLEENDTMDDALVEEHDFLEYLLTKMKGE